MSNITNKLSCLTLFCIFWGLNLNWLFFLIWRFSSLGNLISLCSLIYSFADGVVWNLSFYWFDYSTVIDTLNIPSPVFHLHMDTYDLMTQIDYNESPLFWDIFEILGYYVGLFSLNMELTALSIGNNWPFISAGISSLWVHPNLIICWFVIKRGFLSFNFLLTLFSPCLETAKIIISVSIS